MLIVYQIGRFINFGDSKYREKRTQPTQKIVFTFPKILSWTEIFGNFTEIIEMGLAPEAKVSFDRYEAGSLFGCVYLLPDTDVGAVIEFIIAKLSGMDIRIMNFDGSEPRLIS